MKKYLLFTIRFAGIALGVFIISIFALQLKTYTAPATGIKASKDPVVIERGEYIAQHLSHCGACHGDLKQREAGIPANQLSLNGGMVFPLPIGDIYVPNITADTETGIGLLSDEELARALRYGISHNGKMMLPLMPYQNMSDEDLTAVISYLRTLEPVKNNVPQKSYNLLGKFLNAYVFKPKGPDGTPPAQVTADTGVAYGAYLANNIANCSGCHTPFDPATGQPTGAPYSGGNKFQSVRKNNVVCVSPNLTPHAQHGRITHWTASQFIARFRQGQLIPDSEMPWEYFQDMSDNDLLAIYNYLQSLPTAENNPGPSVITASQVK